jgi:SHS2 domain-containing protein
VSRRSRAAAFRGADGPVGRRVAYTLIDHSADLGIELGAPTLDALFVEGARALFDLVGTLDATLPVEAASICVSGQDVEDLFRAWLSELLFRCFARGCLFSEFRVRSLDALRLEAEAWGEPLDPARHTIEREIKAVTFHGLEVRERPGGWTARVIFDI